MKQAFGDNNFSGNRRLARTDLALDVRSTTEGFSLAAPMRWIATPNSMELMRFFGGGMNFIHFGWDDFGWLCLCVCFKSMSDHVSAAYHEVRYMEPQVPRVREFQRTSSDIFNSDNMSSCVARSPSYTCSKAIPQNL